MAFADVNEVYELYNLIINKNQAGGYLSSDEYNNLAPKVQTRWFNKAYETYGSSQQSEDDLKVLKTSVNLPLNTEGNVTIPSDYFHLDAITSVNYYKKRGILKSTRVQHEIVSTSEYANRIGSDSLVPTKDYPISLLEASTIKTNPTTIPILTLDYLKQPTPPVWAFTVVSGRKVYDSANSTQFEVPEYATPQLVLMLLEEMGVSIRDVDVTQYAVQKEQVNGN